ncbi:bacteriocin [Natrinema soli]|uniref:Bacteriocin n=1 Tax=Natrinema soli TaxID=1930624 RepID=A0ABD5SRF2_9EURY|nr:bacteriocin [Natrinema soli]
MSTNTANATVSDPNSFQSEASMLHEQALFNPRPDQRKAALTEIRKQSPFSPEQWAQFDLAAGIRSEEQVKNDLELTADSTMPVNSWINYEDDVLTEHDSSPNTLQYLIGAGFSTPSTLARYAHVQPMSHGGEQEADISMNARSRSRQDLPSYGLDGVGLPIIHSDWEIDSREFQASQEFGEDIDVRVAGDARDAIEDTEDELLFGGWGGSVQTRDGPFGVRGLNVDNDYVLSGSAAGDFGTAQNVIDTFVGIHQEFEGQDETDAPSPRQTGAIALIPSPQYTELTLQDYETSATDEPLMERLQRKFPYMTFIEAPRLTPGNIVVMLNDTRYFEVVVAQGITSTSWDVDGGFGRRSKMLASRIPWVKEQPDGIYGIARRTGA